MPSAFMGIEMGKRGLIAHTQGMQTTGHNISNAEVDGYSRQRVEMKATDPIFYPALNREERAGQMGQGVDAYRIERIKDMLLEARIVSESNSLGYWTERDKYILMLEQIYNEPTDQSLRFAMDELWKSWQELSLRPTEEAARKAVVERAQAVVDIIHTRFRQLTETRRMLDDDVVGTVYQANTLIRNIAALNEQIVKSQALGDNPNDLMDERDRLVQNLSKIMDITINDKDPNEFMVYTGGRIIVQGKEYEGFTTTSDPENEGYAKITWSGSGEDAYFRGGKLFALLELRDSDVRNEIQKLDLMTVNFVDMVNEIHRKAYNLAGETGNNFFIENPFVDNLLGNYDKNQDGTLDSTYIFRVSGNNTLNPTDQIGISGTLTLSGPLGNVEIPYYPTDTVNDLIERINNSGAEVVARLNEDGFLSLKGIPAADTANPDFVIRHIEDSGQFLVGYAGILKQSGADGAFDWGQAFQVGQLRGEGLEYSVAPLGHPAGWVSISEVIKNDSTRIATSFDPLSGGPEDGRAALAIAELQTKPVMIGQKMSFGDFFSAAVADVGLRGEKAARSLAIEAINLKELNDMKASISGVNIDEEVANMMKFQHGYNATARFISEFDKMLDVIINRMAV